VILIDTNTLIYAGTTCAQQPGARRWLDDRLRGPMRVGLPWESLVGYVRIASNPRVFDPPGEIEALWTQVEAWLAAPPSWTPSPSVDHPSILGRMLRSVPSHRLVHDAHLAALAVEHGLVLCSTDAGFAHFEGLRWENPLAAG